jgi:hypothetical protein
MVFGTIDAKNSLLLDSPSEQELFRQSFVEPPALQIEKFKAKQKYFVTGMKGTGKTALLRYLAIRLDEQVSSRSVFVLFKSEITEELRGDLAIAARIQVVEENSQEFESGDYESVWRWLIYKKIADAVSSEPKVETFQRNANLSNFVELLNSEFGESDKFTLRRLVPSVKKGQVEISKSPKVKIELEWDKNGRAKVDFQKLVRLADDMFELLEPAQQRLNLFFDELEISYESPKKHKRDSHLVRDLVISVERLNGVCKRKAFDVCLYAAIRSEVLTSVQASGKEINKTIADFGSEISWARPGRDTDQPLLDIVEKRINSSRAERQLDVLESKELWDAYFPKQLMGKQPQEFLLHNSWYRPRDFVRHLLVAQEQFPDEVKFTEKVLKSIRKKYSTDSWTELTEELRTSYKPDELAGIRLLLLGFKHRFSVTEMEERTISKREDHIEVVRLLDRHGIRTVLSDLYRIGVLGNANPVTDKFRFSFRGDDDALFQEHFVVHQALRAYLSI